MMPTARQTPSLMPSQQAGAAKIAAAIERAGGVALLCGPQGVGKTTVLAAVAAKLDLPLPPEIEDQPLDPATFVPGQISPLAGRAAVLAVRRAAELALRGDVGAIATAPLISSRAAI